MCFFLTKTVTSYKKFENFYGLNALRFLTKKCKETEEWSGERWIIANAHRGTT